MHVTILFFCHILLKGGDICQDGYEFLKNYGRAYIIKREVIRRIFMKKKRRFFMALVLTVIVFLSFQVLVSAETGIIPRVSYTCCKTGVHSFISEYSTSFGCSQGKTTISLQNTNKAVTRADSVPRSNTYKEAYVGLKNSSGTWKNDTASNSTHGTVGASVNPIAFTPVISQHDLIYYETDGYKMHTRIYQ